MRLNAEVKSFLGGSRISNGYRFPIDHSPTQSRNDLLVDHARGKRVLHVGCADHLSLIREKRRQGTYLHDNLSRVASSLVGTDVNKEALAEMESLGIGDLYHPSALPAGLVFDLVIASDVIEHIPDVHAFLVGLSRYSAPVMLTTPNALNMSNRLSFRSEFINSDHRYWFSPYTLAKTVVEANYDIAGIWYTDDLARRRPIRSTIKRIFPSCRDGIAILAHPRPMGTRESIGE